MTLDEAIAHAREKSQCEGENARDHIQLAEWLQELKIRRQNPKMDCLIEALGFYGNPETYHACMFMFDPPTGGFDEDFGDPEEHGHPAYGRPMPGKKAREAIRVLMGESS